MSKPDEMVQRVARALSKRYPAGEGSAPDEAWYWSTRFDLYGSETIIDAREEDMVMARAAIAVINGPAPNSN